MTTRRFSLICLSFFTLQLLFAQSTLQINSSCNWSGDDFTGAVSVFEPSNEAEQIIKRVTDAMGLEPNFIIKSAAIANALATTENGQRYILYSTTFLENFKRDARTQWAAYCVLAHEIGHHLNNHNFNIENPAQRKLWELQADRFAGNILQKMGASLEEAQAGIETFRLAGETIKHPAKMARSEAVANGWKAAQEGVKLKFEPIVDNEKLSNEWFDKGLNEPDNNKKIEYYSKVIQLRSNDASAFINRGLAKNNLGKYTEALTDFDQAISFKGIYSYLAYSGRGLAKVYLGKYTEAIADYDQVINLKPDFVDAFNGRGLSKRELGKYVEAIADFDEAIRLKNDYPQPYANKGCALVKLERYGEGLDNIRKAEKIDVTFKTTNWVQACKTEALAKLKD